MSWLDPGPTDMDNAEKAEAAARTERERRAREEADQAELAALLLRVQHGDTTAYQLLAVILARVHNVRLHWVRDDPRAVPAKRAIYVRFVDDDESLAEFGHELAHCLCEPCAGLNHVAFDEVGVRTCLQCEIAAWQKALTLLPFSRVAFARLQRALQSYRSSTPAPAAVKAQADRMMSPVTLAEHRQQRLQHELRLERQRAVEAEVSADTLAAQR